MTAAPCPPVVIVMGITGAGKTTVGQALAAALGRDFVDADDFHPPANVAKMADGEPLGDADREPWLAALGAFVHERVAAGAPVVLACSALRARYRSLLAPPDDAAAVAFVFLDVSPALARERLRSRTGHFMPAALVDSQFHTLEPPADALRVDAASTVREIVELVLGALGC